VSSSKQPVVAVVCGGPSAEAEVSRVSGRGVAEALRESYAQVVVLELDREIATALRSCGADVVFPVLHGPPGEDGTFQGLLEICELPYVGSGVQASAYAMDKVVAKHIFRAHGLPVARDVVVSRAEGALAAAQRAFERLGGSVVVKPSRQGSALGVCFADDLAGLEDGLAAAFRFDSQVLVEERIAGREITAAVLERASAEALPVIEVRTPPGTWYDFTHRYTAGQSEHVIPAPLAPATYASTQALAVQAHEALGCRDLSRADFVVPETGSPVLLEVNTMPGMTPTSLYPDAARAAGIDFPSLVALLVERALERVL